MKHIDKRSMLALASLLVFVVGVSLAYVHYELSVDNHFTTVKPEVIIQEKFDPSDKWIPGEEKEKVVSFKNTGSLDMYLRYRLKVRILNENKEDITDAVCQAYQTSLNSLVILNQEGLDATYWENYDDWTYYKKSVKKGEIIGPVLSSVLLSPKFSNDEHHIKYDLSKSTVQVDIEGELIQTTGFDIKELDAGWKNFVQKIVI